MRRPFVIPTFGLALALVPAVLFAQAAPAQPPAGQAPAGQPPAGQTPPAGQAAPAQPSAPKLGFTSPTGVLLVPIKPDQTAAFEEFAKKLKANLARSEDPTIKQQAPTIKIYKSAEPFGANALYVIIVDPVIPNAEYDVFGLLQKTMTPDELRDPATAEMWKKFTAAFASGPSRLSLTPIQ
jgi:Asp-tRNA(Asn)/Glu-tRNA(Gln) amidotransferase A subunit family amidase